MFRCLATRRVLFFYFFNSEHNPSQHPALLGLRGVQPSGQTNIRNAPSLSTGGIYVSLGLAVRENIQQNIFGVSEGKCWPK